MKRYALIVASTLVLSGCQKSEKGTYTESESGTGRSSLTSTNLPGQGTIGTPTERGLGTAPGQLTTPSQLPSKPYEPPPSPPGQSENAGDQAITASVRSALTTGELKALDLGNLRVTTRDGRVTVKGNVKSDADKQQIEEKLKQIPGVLAVEIQLQVVPQGETKPEPKLPGEYPPPAAEPKNQI